MAFVPGITVRQELRDGTLVRIPLRELAVPRRTLMIYREQGYVSDTARELIKIVRAFNWDQGFSDKVALRQPVAAIEPTELAHPDPAQPRIAADQRDHRLTPSAKLGPIQASAHARFERCTASQLQALSPRHDMGERP